mmetsp:Transcript_102579/g.319653  ORF Transcript_102579/g.319653 Transcript_102579/m.319653 type:complete len:232 (-) Transcript_102579:501-1196(-)
MAKLLEVVADDAILQRQLRAGPAVAQDGGGAVLTHDPGREVQGKREVHPVAAPTVPQSAGHVLHRAGEAGHVQEDAFWGLRERLEEGLHVVALHYHGVITRVGVVRDAGIVGRLMVRHVRCNEERYEVDSDHQKHHSCVLQAHAAHEVRLEEDTGLAGDAGPRAARDCKYDPHQGRRRRDALQGVEVQAVELVVCGGLRCQALVVVEGAQRAVRWQPGLPAGKRRVVLGRV